MDIYIKHWDGQGQYDSDYNKIVEWNDKACSWIILPEYEHDNLIYEEDENGISDIPRAIKRADCEDFSSYPDINLYVIYTDHGNEYTDQRYWGHLNYSKEEAIAKLGEYYLYTICKSFSNVTVTLTYNGELIWKKTKE